jgi:hypothetical protein
VIADDFSSQYVEGKVIATDISTWSYMQNQTANNKATFFGDLRGILLI